MEDSEGPAMTELWRRMTDDDRSNEQQRSETRTDRMTGDGAKCSSDLSEEPATVAASNRSTVTDLWRRRCDEAIG